MTILDWIFHRHDWRCTTDIIIGMLNSERSYWHIEKCASCGKYRHAMNHY